MIHIPLSSDQLTTLIGIAIAVGAHYFKTDSKLKKIELTSNGNLSRALQDVKDLVAQCEQLKAQLKQAEADKPKQ